VGKISLTTNIWSNQQLIAFLAVTTHWLLINNSKLTLQSHIDWLPPHDWEALKLLPTPLFSFLSASVLSTKCVVNKFAAGVIDKLIGWTYQYGQYQQ